jgi:hypothetical protein
VRAQGKRPPVTGMRLSPAAIDRRERIADALGTDQTQATEISYYLTAWQLGLLREDIAFAIDSLSRVYGDNGLLVGVIDQYEDDGKSVTFRVLVGATAEGGNVNELVELEDWSGNLTLVKIDSTVAATVRVTHDPSDVTFRLGTIANPVARNALAAKVRDLPDLVLEPKEKDDPFKLRREIRESLALARRFFGRNDEEAPLDED